MKCINNEKIFHLKGSKGSRFTEQESAFIRKNYLRLNYHELAEQMGRSISGIRHNIKLLGLCISKEIRLKRQQSSYFKAGHTPINKGLKGVCAPGCEKTWFKKGHAPSNTLYDGKVTIRCNNRQKRDGGYMYKWIRVSKGKWIPLHQHVWIKKHGPIPEGYTLRFKNKDTLDCRLNNLELISRAQQLGDNGYNFLSDNYIAARLAPRDAEKRKLFKTNKELVELKRNELKLRRAIKYVESNQT